MKKSILCFFSVLSFSFNFLLTDNLSAQTASTTIVYSGFQACGGCTVCGADYYCFNTLSSYCGNTAACNTRTFVDPVPAGNIVTSVTVNYFSAQCTGGSLSATINGNSVPTVNEGNTGCPCSASPCGQSASSSSSFPCGLPGYINGGTNSLQLCTGANVCINRLVLVLTYAPANQASPATQPTSVLGQTNVCPGAIQTYSCPAVANAASYNWTLPAGWTLNSGAGTNVITATPGSAGNVCVRAQNLCGNSIYTCISVGLLTASTPPTSASASPNPVCASASTTTLNLSGGSLGTAANWNWYSGSCGGTLVGTGSSITVSPSSTTTYYVSATGTCNTTACASVVFTVNPAPTANAGTPKVLSCSVTNTILSGSGGGTYSWSGPGIVSGGTTATPTVNSPGTYSLIVTSAGCPSTVSTVVVTSNTTAPTAGASSTGTLGCSASTATLTGTGGGTYSWSGTGIVSGGATANPVVNGAGPYVVIVTAANGCTATANTSVTQNTTAPIAGASNTATLTCSTTTAALTATGGGSYSWSGTGIVSGGTTANPIVNGTGPYVVTVTAANGCTATANTSVAQDITPPTPSAGSSGSLTCNTTTAALTATGGGTYSWSGTGIISGGTTANPIVNGAGPYVVTVTAANGCTATANTSVAQNTTAPIAGASNTATLTCNTTTAALTATGGGTYNWTGTGIISGGTTANPIVNGTGPYVVTVMAANGCTATANTSVAQDITPPTPSASSSGSLTCTTNTVTLTSTGGGTYSWTGPSIVSGTNTANADVDQIGNYTVTVTAANGCTATTNITVGQNTITPTVTMPATQTITCASPSVTLIASANPSTCTPVWTGGVSSGVNSYTATASSATIYTLTITDPSNGCTASGTTQVVPSAGFPSVNATASNPITCVTTTAQVVATTTSTPVSYSWSGPGITSGAATATADVNAGGQYTVVVQNTTSMCSSTITIGVVTNTTPTTPTISTTGSITCSTTSLTVNSIPSSGVTYTWTGTGIVGSSNSQNVDVNQGGIYTLSVTNTDGCVGTETISVASNTIVPSFTLGTAPSVTTTCAAPNTTLSATSDADPNSIYTWTTPSSGTVVGNPLVASAPGIYTVVVTNTINGCSTSATSPATVEIVADSGIPVVTLSSSTASITCSDPTPSVSITTTATPVTYSWSPTTGIVPGTETTANPVFNAAGSYSAVVTNTASGCSTSTSGNVVTVTLDNTIPVITLSAGTNSAAINCINPQVIITPIVTPSVNLTYTWSPAGVTSTAIDNATFTAAGVYTLAVTNTVTGCVSTSTSSANTFTVTLDNTVPTASINVLSSNTSIGCGASNATVTLDGSSSTSSNPSPVIGWLPGPIPGNTLPVTTAGTYTLVVVDAVNGCADSTQITVTGNTNPPQGVNAGGSANIACGSSSTILNGVTTTTNTSYSWVGPSGTSIISGGTTLSPIVSEVGDYTLTVTDNSTGCSDSSVVNVTQASATASITANPTTGISPLVVAFTGAGSGTPAFNWNFGDGNTSSFQNPSNTFVTGTYTVTLTTTSGTCTATSTVVIIVEDGFTIEIPNVFTPNGDNANDFFTIKSTGVKEISLQIFNRWGEKLYEFSGAKASWDGLTPTGHKVSEGTYFYFVKATGFDGAEFEKHGSVNLFR